MIQYWRAMLPAARLEDDGLIVSFGDADGELGAAAGGATVAAPLPHLAPILCGGADSRSFLQNQLTSDISHLKSGHAQHSAWCTAKGRMLASFLVVNADDSLHLIVAEDLLDTVLKRLKMFVLRSQVTLADGRDSLAIVGVAGPRAAEGLAAASLPAPAEVLRAENSAAGISVRLDADRFVVAARTDSLPAVWNALTRVARPVGTPVWRWLDVRAGLPLVDAATSEEFVPQMADFDKLGGVSFHKGCYPGQEVVARTQYLGKVKRHLYRARGTDVLRPGDKLFGSGSDSDPACGMIAVAAPSPDGGWIALAVLQESALAGQVRVGSPHGSPLQQLTAVAD